jgi:hypothetical protein
MGTECAPLSLVFLPGKDYHFYEAISDWEE